MRAVLPLVVLGIVACGAPYREIDVQRLDARSGPSAAPTERVKIGDGCISGPTSPELLCGKGDRIAGVYFVYSTPDGTSEPASLEARVDGSRIEANAGCPYCRTITGWHFTGDLDLMTDDQRRALQRRLSLPTAPLLTAQSEWRAALGRAQPAR